MKLTPEQRAIVQQAKAITNAPKREMRHKARERQKSLGKADRGRIRDGGFLAYLRRLPCIAGLVEGNCDGPIEAAHVRYSDAKVGRVNPGKSVKPDDCWCAPMCRHHHQHDQHTGSERGFWERIGIDPGELCPALYAAYQSNQDGAPVIARFIQRGV